MYLKPGGWWRRATRRLCGTMTRYAPLISAVGRLDIEKSSFVSLSQAKGELKARQGVGGNHQSGIRNPDSPDPLAFWRRYSAWVTSARFSSETDFCSFAILIASQNEASI